MEEVDLLVEDIKASCANPFENAKEWSGEEKDTYLQSLRDEPCPLWMDEEEIAEARRNGNKKLKALEEMVYDQDPDVLAEQFKDQGNSYFKRGETCYEAAIRCYTDGIEQAKRALSLLEENTADRSCEENGTETPDCIKKEGEEEEEEEDENTIGMDKDALIKLWGTLLANRAAVNLKLKNFRSVILDCMETVNIDPTNPKAYYRASKAAQGLKRYKKALHILSQGEVALPGGHPSFEKLKSKLVKLREEQTKERRAKKRIEKEKKQRDMIVKKALEIRGVKMMPILFEAMRQYDGKPTLDDSGKVMHWPLLFLYEEHGQSDHVRDATELDMIHAHLEDMFPCEDDLKGCGRSNVSLASWDNDRAYTLERLVVFIRLWCSSRQDAAVSEQRWARIHVGATLANVLRHPGCEVPGFPVFWVLSKGSDYHRSFLKKWDGAIEDILPSSPTAQ